MKIIKKTAFKKAVLLKEEFREITKKFTEIKNKGGNAGLSRTENISELNFFFVIEYVNIADKINYEKIFPNDDFIIDIEGLLNEQDKIIQHINKRKENYHDIFYNLFVLFLKIRFVFLHFLNMRVCCEVFVFGVQFGNGYFA